MYIVSWIYSQGKDNIMFEQRKDILLYIVECSYSQWKEIVYFIVYSILFLQLVDKEMIFKCMNGGQIFCCV